MGRKKGGRKARKEGRKKRKKGRKGKKEKRKVMSTAVPVYTSC